MQVGSVLIGGKLLVVREVSIDPKTLQETSRRFAEAQLRYIRRILVLFLVKILEEIIFHIKLEDSRRQEKKRITCLVNFPDIGRDSFIMESRLYIQDVSTRYPQKSREATVSYPRESS